MVIIVKNTSILCMNRIKSIKLNKYHLDRKLVFESENTERRKVFDSHNLIYRETEGVQAHSVLLEVVHFLLFILCLMSFFQASCLNS